MFAERSIVYVMLHFSMLKEQASVSLKRKERGWGGISPVPFSLAHPTVSGDLAKS